MSVVPPVGLVYDDRMCGHATPDGAPHPEKPDRLRSIWRKLQQQGITDRCVVLKAKEAEDEYIASVHTLNHIKLIKNISSKELDSKRHTIARKYNSIYFNKGSSESAYLAAGSTIEVTEKVAKGELSSGIALVRPPGHHAECNKPMGFCLFNNIAIAANFLLNERAELGIKKILIVDWDVHHGNGTQNTFYKDSRVLFFSVHRFDGGTFYPAGLDGAHFMVGDGDGQGYNINVPWEHERCGDADYSAVWDHVLIPVAERFEPDVILVSAGFDAASGDPLGGCCITPQGYARLLQKLKKFANGKIVMVLEGGYNLKSIANSVLACAQVLLGDEVSKSDGNLNDVKPFETTWQIIKNVRDELKRYWPVLAGEIPEEEMKNPRNISSLKEYWSSESESELEETEGPTCEINSVEVANGDEVSLKLSELNIAESASSSVVTFALDIADASAPWRSDLSKVYVWYATYGSNLSKPRLLCYILGGKVEGMSKEGHGSCDKTLPKEIKWKTVPHKLFFGRSYTRFWGEGGVAFLHPLTINNTDEKSYVCMYKITLEQFNDVLFQENVHLFEHYGKEEYFLSPLVDLKDIDLVSKNKSLNLEAFKNGYPNVLYLGTEDDIPILTMTCSVSDIQEYKSGKFPMAPPAKKYVNVLIKGLVEGGQLTEEEAVDYINAATATTVTKNI
ncbi:hypothetical protein LUZ60_006475 [Juncus effusus]|nr:hypothetical protein LUZ60_006475 [Juncus effusus]